MKRVLLLGLAVGALAAVPAAAAGGWATAGTSSPPSGIDAGDTWNAQVTILQHGRTPLSGAEPTLTIRKKDGTSKTFAATPTGKPGVYEANVKFPSAGAWSYEVYDGFTQYGGPKTHTFGSIAVAPGSGGSSMVLWLVLLGLAAAVVVAGVAVLPRLARVRIPVAARR